MLLVPATDMQRTKFIDITVAKVEKSAPTVSLLLVNKFLLC